MISFNFVVAFSFFLSFFRGELGINERNKRCCLLEREPFVGESHWKITKLWVTLKKVCKKYPISNVFALLFESNNLLFG